MVKDFNKAIKGKNPPKESEKTDAELKAIKEAEEEKRIQEAEQARKRAEEEARAAYKPKTYTDEEKKAWDAYKEEIIQFFADIIMKQSNKKAED